MPVVYLIPSLLDEEGSDTIPPYIIDAIKDCQVFYVENERTTRRYFKKIWKEMVIDAYEWYVMSDKSETEATAKGAATHAELFRTNLLQDKNIGIVSEAGCPGIADPGQRLIAIAQELNIPVKPLVGPSSILLALMASGMNGQHFQFLGYLPIDTQVRNKTIRQVEAESSGKNCTQIFIETPYRNNQLFDALLKNCAASTSLCIAVNLTGNKEWIKTKKISDWKKTEITLPKEPAIFLLHAQH